MLKNLVKRIDRLRCAFVVMCMAILWAIVGHRVIDAFLQTGLGRRYDEFLNHLSARTQTLIVLILILVIPGITVIIDGMKTLVEWRRTNRKVHEKHQASMEEIVRKAREEASRRGRRSPLRG